jgi:uncharacterized membrane protein
MLAPVALVKAVGQVETLINLMVGRFYFKERLSNREALGVIVIAAGLILAAGYL